MLPARLLERVCNSHGLSVTLNALQDVAARVDLAFAEVRVGSIELELSVSHGIVEIARAKHVRVGIVSGGPLSQLLLMERSTCCNGC